MLLTRYRALLEEVGVKEIRVGNEARQSMPYSLLLTARWMLLVPRSRECFRDISVNALGYAGSFFLRDDGQLSEVRRAGPMAVLQAVSIPP